MSEKVVAPYGKLSTTAQSPPPRPALSIASYHSHKRDSHVVVVYPQVLHKLTCHHQTNREAMSPEHCCRYLVHRPTPPIACLPQRIAVPWPLAGIDGSPSTSSPGLVPFLFSTQATIRVFPPSHVFLHLACLGVGWIVLGHVVGLPIVAAPFSLRSPSQGQEGPI